MSLSLFRFAADHPITILISAAVYGVSMTRMIGLVKICEERAKTSIPDLQFGFSASQLREMMDAWGKDGRQAYLQANTLDLFPYMESYAVCLGALLVMASRCHEKWIDSIANLSVVILLLDIGETLVVQYAAQHHPDYLVSETVIMVGSVCNQLKWTVFAVSVGLVIVGFLLPRKAGKMKGK